jgi:hypothetical protein
MRIERGRGVPQGPLPKKLKETRDHTKAVVQEFMTTVYSGKPIPHPSKKLPASTTPQKVNQFVPKRILGKS